MQAHDGTRTPARRTPLGLAPLAVIGAIAVAGYFDAARGDADADAAPTQVLLLVMSAAAAGFGALMTPRRGLRMTILLLVASVGGALAGDADIGREFDDGAAFILIGILAFSVIVVAAWLTGAAARVVWRLTMRWLEALGPTRRDAPTGGRER